MNNLSTTYRILGKLHLAEQLIRKTINLKSNWLGNKHPLTLTAKGNLAHVLANAGKLSEAERILKDVISTRESIFGKAHQTTLSDQIDLARIAFISGDLRQAQLIEKATYKAQALALGLNHPDTLNTKNNLAVTTRELGDFASARLMQEEILESTDLTLGPDHPKTITARGNLAFTLRMLGEFRDALRHYTFILEHQRNSLGEDHVFTLGAKSNLALLMKSIGEIDNALDLEQEVLNSRIRILGSRHADSLTARNNLAITLRQMERYQEALRHQEESLKLQVAQSGENHPDTVIFQQDLATTLFYAGYYTESINQIKKAIQSRYETHLSFEQPYNIIDASNFLILASSQHRLGITDQESLTLLRLSSENFNKGLEILEANIAISDISKGTQIRHKEIFSKYYQEAIANAIFSNQKGNALHITERYKTQALTDFLKLHRANPENEAQRNKITSLALKYDNLTQQIANRYPEPAQDLLEEQAKLRRRREVIQGQIIAERRASGDFPKPLKADAIQQSLDPGTLMLSYSIGDEDSHLFVLGPEGPIDVYPIAVDAEQIELQANRLRASDVDPSSDESRENLSGWLYDKLLAPAAARIAEAERVVILPDAALHYLHFAALTMPADDDPRGWRYLIEHKPIHVVQSATVYAELLSRRPAGNDAFDPRNLKWVGVGNAVYPVKVEEATETASVDDLLDFDKQRSTILMRSATERGIWRGLTELPHTQREVHAIYEQFPEGNAVVLTDRDANEDRVRANLADARVAHFAVHGLAHPDQPMDSFLALSQLDEGFEHNGLLQAWEIVDHLQLDADLVVLSGCETAVGPERRGEGLISVSRAFQIAGARSVLASLWLVNDISTAELMIRFYRHWLGGQSKDEALRSAQIDLIRGPVDVPHADGAIETHDFSAPRHWAGFQLIGDWR